MSDTEVLLAVFKRVLTQPDVHRDGYVELRSYGDLVVDGTWAVTDDEAAVLGRLIARERWTRGGAVVKGEQ